MIVRVIKLRAVMVGIMNINSLGYVGSVPGGNPPGLINAFRRTLMALQGAHVDEVSILMILIAFCSRADLDSRPIHVRCNSITPRAPFRGCFGALALCLSKRIVQDFWCRFYSSASTTTTT